jgi:hypothetical protein
LLDEGLDFGGGGVGHDLDDSMGCGALGRQPAGLARPATSFHLLAQMKGGKAKCPNASDPTELHGWKESSVDDGRLRSN